MSKTKCGVTSQNDTHNLSKGSSVLSHMKNQKWNYLPLFTIILSFLIASLFAVIEVLIFLYVLSYCLVSFHFTSRVILSISGRAGQGVTYSLSFSLAENVAISPSLLKNSFAVCFVSF